MNHDQADELRQLVRSQVRQIARSETNPHLIAVTGGQRGVGTTTLALNLAVSMALAGQRTILVDADLDRGVIAGMCGLGERDSIVDVLSGRQTIHAVLARGPAGIQLVPGAWAPKQAHECSAAAQNRLIAQLKALGPYADAVVIDTGCARNSFVRRFWQATDVPLVVTTPEPMAIMDCYATIKVLLAGEASISPLTVVNRTPDAERAGEVQQRIAAACRRFLGVRAIAAGHVPDEPLLGSEAPTDVPLVLSSPRSRIARSLELLAEQVTAICNQRAKARMVEGVAAA